ncbi:histidine ammonia-lyase, partial [bacterium]|nr:histidine ammonia-lyase [bacterium]
MIGLDGNTLTLESFHGVVFGKEAVSLTEVARQNILNSRKIVETAVQKNEKVYSINTGFGFLSKVTIPSDKLKQLQVNLIRSHASGIGEVHTEEESRAILLLRTNVLAKGFSGIGLSIVELLVELLNHHIHPVIPSQGSVGASGDLAPLAHLALTVIGEGDCFYEGQRMSSQVALQKAGLKPCELGPKEGLSLINGTQQMT